MSVSVACRDMDHEGCMRPRTCTCFCRHEWAKTDVEIAADRGVRLVKNVGVSVDEAAAAISETVQASGTKLAELQLKPEGHTSTCPCPRCEYADLVAADRDNASEHGRELTKLKGTARPRAATWPACPECAAEGVEKRCRDGTGLSAHRRIRHGVVSQTARAREYRETRTHDDGSAT